MLRVVNEAAVDRVPSAIVPVRCHDAVEGLWSAPARVYHTIVILEDGESYRGNYTRLSPSLVVDQR